MIYGCKLFNHQVKYLLNQLNVDCNKENKFHLSFLRFAMANANDNDNTHNFNGSNILLITYLTTSTAGDKILNSSVC